MTQLNGLKQQLEHDADIKLEKAENEHLKEVGELKIALSEKEKELAVCKALMDSK